MGRRQWIRMRIGNKNTLLRLLDSKLAHALDIIIEQAHEDGTWISSLEERDFIQKRIGISPPTFFRYINQLVNKSILLPQPGRGVYRLNRDLIQISS